MKDRDKYLDKYLGKEIWGCDFYSTRINLQTPFLTLCHDAFVGPQKIGYLEGYSPEKYYKAISELIDENEINMNSHCRKCAKCTRRRFNESKLNWITINTYWYCNSSCIYCGGHYSTDYDEVLSVIKQFHDQKLFDEKCLFDWGGRGTNS